MTTNWTAWRRPQTSSSTRASAARPSSLVPAPTSSRYPSGTAITSPRASRSRWPSRSRNRRRYRMPQEITWNDAEEIGIQLQEKYPDLDPLTVRFTDLHRYVTELEGFADDPAKSNEAKLEAIQTAWHEEYKDAQ